MNARTRASDILPTPKQQSTACWKFPTRRHLVTSLKVRARSEKNYLSTGSSGLKSIFGTSATFSCTAATEGGTTALAIAPALLHSQTTNWLSNLNQNRRNHQSQTAHLSLFFLQRFVLRPSRQVSLWLFLRVCLLRYINLDCSI